ncbi:hypothetical protein SABIM44S_00353 [Streptomyces abikoensis]
MGLAGIFPKARDLPAFWDNVVQGRDCTEEVPEQWWDVGLHHNPDPFAEDKTYCRRGGFLSPEVVDPRACGMPPNSLDSTGLVQLLALRVAADVLQDAAIGRSEWYDPGRTGVVLGVCGTNSTLLPLAGRLMVHEMRRTMLECGIPEEDVHRVVRAHLAGLPPWTEDSFPGVLGNVVAGRIANRLNLGAANYTVDAACASSLAAVRCAVDELVSRRADMMITGGCDADNSVVSFMCFSKTPALSPTGLARPFDADADGTLVGEGLGMLALKRLADARRDGDRIYAVLRGLGSSSDGSGQSIYAPCGEGQVTALRRAYQDAGCSPHSVGLIEAHGTGTPAGDAVELTALESLLRSGEGHPPVPVGSVKSQIGHTKAAAGAAGLIKAALALHHKVLPPTLHVRRPSEPLTRADSPLYVNTVARPWVREPSRPVRRAGVSAFGFGGVNYHAVLEEPSDQRHQEERAAHRVPRAYLWHAKTPEELRRRLEEGEPADDGPVPAGHARIGFVSRDEEECAELRAVAVDRLRLNAAHEHWTYGRGIYFRRHGLDPDVRVGALFPGQGSQYTEMGREAALAIPTVRTALDAANDLFKGPDNLVRVLFPPTALDDRHDREERLRRTAYAQPAIGALSAGQYAFLRELGFVPHAVLGHSFGELTALWAAGVLDDASFTALAHARGRAMRPEPGHDAGAMVAVRASEDTIRSLPTGRDGLVVCNRNAPDEQVIGGPTEAVEEFVRHCAAAGVPAVRLRVDAAFHTSLVAHAVEPFALACAKEEFGPPRLRVQANTTGAVYGDDPEANRRVLVEQLRQPVDFAARLEEMYADGVRVFVECGPRGTLSALVERVLGDRGAISMACDAGPGTDSCAALKRAAVRLAVLGLPLSGINRYDMLPAPERPAPSKAARTLAGPQFATVARRPAYRAAVAEAASAVREGHRHFQLPQADRGTEDAELSRALAAHLTAHNRYLASQVQVAEQLTDLMREGTRQGQADPSLVRSVTAVTEHSIAVASSHAKAGEVISRLLLPAEGERDGGHGVSDPPAPFVPRPSNGTTDLVAALGDHQDLPEGERSGRSALAELWDATREGTPAAQPAEGQEADLEEIERVLLEVTAEKTGYDVGMIEPDFSIQEDLGLDSLKRVEIGAEVWRRYPHIDRAALYRLNEARTVRELSERFYEIMRSPDVQERAAGEITCGTATVGLRELPPPDVLQDAYPPDRTAVVLDDGMELSAVVTDALLGEGWQVRRLRLPVSEPSGAEGAVEPGRALKGWSEPELEVALAELGLPDERVRLCVLPFGRSPQPQAAQVVERLCHAVLVAKHGSPALRKAAATGGRAALVTVTQLDGSLGLAGRAEAAARTLTPDAFSGGLAGLVKTVALEEPALFCRALDFAPGLTAREVGAAFIAEISDLATDLREVGWDAEGRRTVCLDRTEAPLPLREAEATAPAPSTDRGLMLVTGGASGITSWCVTALADDARFDYLLLGRTPLSDEPAWATGRETADELRDGLSEQARGDGQDPAAREVRDRIEEEVRLLLRQRDIRSVLHDIRSRGAEAEYVAVDVRDGSAVAEALKPYTPRITAVLHGAGVLGDKPLTDMVPESVAAVVGTKVHGLHNVLNALDTGRLRHLVVFSSVSGIWGNARQADYALANEALNRFARSFARTHPDCCVLPVAWGPWAGGMAARLRELYLDMGIPVLTREAGCEHFRQLMARNVRSTDGPVVVVGPLEPLFRRVEQLPETGLVARHALTGRAGEPMLCDHRLGGIPVLPMTALVGHGLHVVERALGGTGTVVECRDFRIVRGAGFPPGHPEAARVRLRPESAQGGRRCVRVSVHSDDDKENLYYEGSFLWSDQGPQPAPRIEVPPFTFTDGPHPGYSDGRLFHGPSLAGLHNELENEDGNARGRLVVVARMPEPPLAKGAYAGRLHHPGLADLLVQAASLAVLRHARGNVKPIPVSVEHVELFAPLPPEEPFVISAEVRECDGVFPMGDITACTPEGQVLQRWTGVRSLWADPADLLRAAMATLRDGA